MIPPPPTPWIALPTRIMARSTARAQIKLPTRKMKLTKSRIGLLPQISLTLPQNVAQAALASKYEEAIQE